MAHVQIKATCTGDKITAISETLKAAKGYGGRIYLEFKEGYTISVEPTSHVQDLITIQRLEEQLLEANK